MPHTSLPVLAFSPVLREIIDKVKKASKARRRLLICGDSGTGKTFLARLYYQEAVLEGNFVPLNCANFKGPLFESELFGHVKGAFTGADEDKVGKVQLAERGVLFLDEIGTLEIQTQEKLLTLLDEPDGYYYRVGGKSKRRPLFSLVSATSDDLTAKVQDGSFKVSIYSRISYVDVVIPSLKERPEDIEGFARHYLEEEARKAGRTFSLDTDAIEFLKQLTYQGNLRTLKKIVMNATDMAGPDGVISRELLMDLNISGAEVVLPLPSRADELKRVPGFLEIFCSLHEMSEREALKGPLEDFLRRHHVIILPRIQEALYQTMSECMQQRAGDQEILQLYRRYNRNCSAVARHMGVNPSTISRRIKRIKGDPKSLH
jgi:transcriptional regulator with PAS, ATPase and Fis domain